MAFYGCSNQYGNPAWGHYGRLSTTAANMSTWAAIPVGNNWGTSIRSRKGLHTGVANDILQGPSGSERHEIGCCLLSEAKVDRLFQRYDPDMI